MPTERVLIEIVTAANMAGVEQAQAGFLGFTPQVLLAGAALAGLVFVGKSAVENYEAQTKATLDLTQAYGTQKDTLAAHQKQIDAFLETNKRFIADQYDTQAALAQAVRAGHDQTDAMRMLNDALDLSVIKHVAVSEAMNGLILAEAGNSRGLRFLGITTVEYNEIMKSKLSVEEKDAALLALVETRTKNGRLATTELAQSQQALNKDWQDFTARIGPAVVKGLDLITSEMDKEVQQAGQLIDALRNAVGFAGQLLHGSGPPPSNTSRGGGHSGGGHPQTLAMGGSGDGVVGAGATVVVNVYGSVQTERQLHLAIRDGIRRLDRAQT